MAQGAGGNIALIDGTSTPAADPSACNASQYFEIDFGVGVTKQIRQLQVKTAASFGYNAAITYNFMWSDNNATWTTVSSFTIPIGTGVTTTFNFPASSYHRYWKAQYLSGTLGANTWIEEIQMMEAIAANIVPGAPTIGVANAGDTLASVNFSVPVDNGGPAITSYTVTSIPDGITGTGTSSPVNVTGLTNGAPYTFRVTATNSVGTGPASAASNIATPAISNLLATGGTITYNGGYTVHTFTSSGTFQITNGSGNLDYLVVAGGGGGGGNAAGGGGAGGFISSSALYGTGSYAVTVGAGGAGGGSTVFGSNGQNSVFDTVTALGGGGGAPFNSAGHSGGSGGGGGSVNSGAALAGGASTSGQGNTGGAGNLNSGFNAGGGGGGAGAIGTAATNPGAGGAGGVGVANSITGASVYYAGGGGGAGCGANGGGAGGNGGGGSGANGTQSSGTANTGGGGGGGTCSGAGTAGGSGVVIIRYR
jgi:hypothetical protein